MKRLLTVLVIIVSIGTAGVVYAQDFGKGIRAYGNSDFVTAFKECKVLADQGHVDAQYNLGLMYKNGQGVLQDYGAAVKWYRKAAERGYASAQINLGLMYYDGEGVSQDTIAAHMWWNIAAANGRTTALKNRDIAARKLSSTQIIEAQKKAKLCMASGYKQCD